MAGRKRKYFTIGQEREARRLWMQNFIKNNREIHNQRSKIAMQKYNKKNRELINQKRRDFRRTAHGQTYQKQRTKRKLEEGYFEEYYRRKLIKLNQDRALKGLPPIRQFKKEALMKNILDQIFPNEPHLDNKFFRLDLINNFIRYGLKDSLQLDRYYVKLKLAFEYNGGQHYSMQWNRISTLKSFFNILNNDARKQEMCKLAGVKLIIIRYDEKLSKELILNK
ncbi:MAG: hypothetical protein AABY22_26005, partial [Nanoarchaeota archaeon]